VTRRVLLIGRSRLVLDESVAGLRAMGYDAEGTNDFADVTTRFDPTHLDLVVFGGQVPAERKAELREEIAAANPRVIFVQGLAGIPGLIVDQVQGAFGAHDHGAGTVPVFTPEDRTIRLALAVPADVKVTAWWQTSFVPPDPKSDSLLLLADRLDAGHHVVAVPDVVPASAAFATAQIDAVIYAFSIAADR
jgi:hypothetical protein